jgi:hypothetical protein
VKGSLILLVFFFLFALVSLLIPSPMFPGSLFSSLIGSTVNSYVSYLSALLNGVFYGMILWIVFVAISRKLFEK